MPATSAHHQSEEVGLAQLVADFVGVLDNFARTQRELIDGLRLLREQLPPAPHTRPPLWLPPPPSTTSPPGGKRPLPPAPLPQSPLPPPPRLPPPPSGAWRPLPPSPQPARAEVRPAPDAHPARPGDTGRASAPTEVDDGGPGVIAAPAATLETHTTVGKTPEPGAASTKRDYDYFVELDARLEQLRNTGGSGERGRARPLRSGPHLKPARPEPVRGIDPHHR